MCARATIVDQPSVRTVLDPERMAKKIRIGIVGLGHRSVYATMPNLMGFEEYELVGVCDIREKVVKKTVEIAKESYHRPITGYTDFSKMLKDEQLDAVAITIDPDKQIPLACEAMEAGCHVMVEVPTAYTIEDCWRAVVTQERTGRHFMLMEQMRFAGYIRAWRKIVDSGVIGKPLYVEGEYFGCKPDAFFQDDEGRFYTTEQAQRYKKAKPVWRHLVPPIVYLPHELSPLLYAIKDRVKRVVAMSTRKHSYKYPNLEKADMQVALMHTEKDVIMRMAVAHSSAAITRGELGSHWHHIKGSDGVLEWKRSSSDKPKMYVDSWQTRNPIEVEEWTIAQPKGPAEAAQSGHGGVDYYVYAQFADAILRGIALELDVYGSMDIAAPAIMAAKSIAEENTPQEVPDFRPHQDRKAGDYPRGMKL